MSSRVDTGWGVRRRIASLLTLGAGLALVIALMMASPAKAQTLTVTKTADTADGACDADCSLREAIVAANDTAEADTISFAQGVSGEIALSKGQLRIASGGGALSIEGPGEGQLAVDGGKREARESKVLLVERGAEAEITGLTLRDGSPNHLESRWGGGILNRGTLTLNDSTVSGGWVLESGGGIYNTGTMTINNSTVSDNEAPLNRGAGISNVGTMKITGSTISDNVSMGNPGGGISNSGTLTIDDSTVSGNKSKSEDSRYGRDGGGIYSSTDWVTASNPNPEERTVIRNSTISGNEALRYGGGVYNRDGLTIIENSTITNNIANENKGAGVGSFGSSFARTEVRNSIISNNTGTDADFTGSYFKDNTFTSLGSNIVGSGNATEAFSKTGDKTGVENPGLADLADNGGPSQTHALLADSPAIDAVEGACNVNADQRDVLRAQDGNSDGSYVCDIGAFELEGPPDTIKPTVSGNSPKGVTSDTTPTIKATVKDDTTELAKSDIKLSVDGKEKTDFSYDETTDQLTYTTGSLANGSHSVKIVATDAWDNASEESWDFTVDASEPNVDTDTTKPTISRFSPKVRTFDRTPRIKAIVKDNATDLRKGNIKLYVDGKKKGKFRYNRSKNKLVYQSKRLSYKRHSVRIVVRDEAGNVAKKTWRFKVMKRR